MSKAWAGSAARSPSSGAGPRPTHLAPMPSYSAARTPRPRQSGNIRPRCTCIGVATAGRSPRGDKAPRPGWRGSHRPGRPGRCARRSLSARPADSPPGVPRPAPGRRWCLRWRRGWPFRRARAGSPGGAAAGMPESLPGRGREHRLGRFAPRDQHGQPPQRRLGVRELAQLLFPAHPGRERSSSRRSLRRSSPPCRRPPAEAGCRASRAGCHRARRAPRPRPLTARTRPSRAAPRRRR